MWLRVNSCEGNRKTKSGECIISREHENMELKVESCLLLFLLAVAVAAVEVCNCALAELCPLFQATSLAAR